MAKTHRVFVGLCACFMLFVTGIKAQIVNVENKRSSTSNEGWHGSANLGLNLTKNTASVLDYGIRTNVQYLKNAHRLLFLADLDRVQAGGEDFVNNGYLHVRYNYELGAQRRFALEAFNQVQFNSVQRIGYRHLAGAGLRYSVHQSDSLKCWMGTLPMYEYEELTTEIIERNIRQSTYFLFFIERKHFEFQTISYYQPRWGDVEDFRLSNSSTIEFGILKWLRFASTLELTYDSRPPAEVPSLVYALKNGLKLEF